MTAKQICAILFPADTDDAKNSAYLRQLVLDLKNTPKTVPAEDVFKRDTPDYRVDTNLVRYDYLSFLETGKPEVHGEYMSQYSWAEVTLARLFWKKENENYKRYAYKHNTVVSYHSPSLFSELSHRQSNSDCENFKFMSFTSSLILNRRYFFSTGFSLLILSYVI